MRMLKNEKVDQSMSLRGLGRKQSFEIFRKAVTSVFKSAGKVMPGSIRDDSEIIVKVSGNVKDPNKIYHYRSLIFDCRDVQDWYFYADRDTIGSWKRLYAEKDLIEELMTIKDKFEKEQIFIEVRANHINLALN